MLNQQNFFRSITALIPNIVGSTKYRPCTLGCEFKASELFEERFYCHITVYLSKLTDKIDILGYCFFPFITETNLSFNIVL